MNVLGYKLGLVRMMMMKVMECLLKMLWKVYECSRLLQVNIFGFGEHVCALHSTVLS